MDNDKNIKNDINELASDTCIDNAETIDSRNVIDNSKAIEIAEATENKEAAGDALQAEVTTTEIASNDKNKKLFIIAGIAAAVILLAVIIIIFVNKSKKEDFTQLAENTVPSQIPDKALSENSETNLNLMATPIPAVTEEPSPELTPEPTEAPTPTPFDAPKAVVHKDESQSELTGLWTSNEITKMRPYCIMFNNIEFANPQSGISCADILYEALTEGGITRMMGVFEGLTEESSCAKRIGSVRSARHYFASFADEYDSVFVHFGETTYATKRIAALNLDHLEGTYGIGDTVFYRDKTIKAPHNAFASLAGIQKGIEKMKFRDEHKDDWKQNHFLFVDPDLEAFMNEETEDISSEDADVSVNEESVLSNASDSESDNFDEIFTDESSSLADIEESAEEVLSKEELMEFIKADENYSGSGYAFCSIYGKPVTPANKITLNYSNYMCPYLIYDEETGLYTRYQYKGVHIDYNTNEPLTFKNVIIQIVHEWDKDKNGYQDMELHDASGTGYYITEGCCIPISWKKNENKRSMHYYTEDGNILVLNNGKTFISAYPDFRIGKLIIE